MQNGFADDAVDIPLSNGTFIPAFANKPPGENHELEDAIIVLHGALRDSESYYLFVKDSVKNMGREPTSVVVAINFPPTNCTAEQWLQSPSSRRRSNASALVWSNLAYEYEHESWWSSGSLDDTDNMSSFELVDAAVQWTERNYMGIKKITVAGFSASGSMLARWAIFSPHGAGGVSLSGLPLSVIAGNPSLLTYLDETRPIRSCSPAYDTGPDHECPRFEVPDQSGLGADSCGGAWNRYPFGLQGIGEGTVGAQLDVGEYLRRTGLVLRGASLAQAMRERFATKSVSFIFGKKDVHSLACNNTGCCSARGGGTTRLQLGLNYLSHLRTALPRYEPKYEILDISHSHADCWLQSISFGLWAFSEPKVAWDWACYSKNTSTSCPWTGIKGRIELENFHGVNESQPDSCGECNCCLRWTQLNDTVLIRALGKHGPTAGRAYPYVEPNARAPASMMDAMLTLADCALILLSLVVAFPCYVCYRAASGEADWLGVDKEPDSESTRRFMLLRKQQSVAEARLQVI